MPALPLACGVTLGQSHNDSWEEGLPQPPPRCPPALRLPESPDSLLYLRGGKRRMVPAPPLQAALSWVSTSVQTGFLVREPNVVITCVLA